MNLLELPQTWFMVVAVLTAIIYWFRAPKMQHSTAFFRYLIPIYCLWTAIVLHPTLNDPQFIIFMGSLVIILTLSLFLFDIFMDVVEGFQRSTSKEAKIEKSLPNYLLEATHAVGYLASRHTGALIVIERRDPLKDKVDGGMPFDAEVKAEALTALFSKTSPLHDGALLIIKGRIKRVKTILPLRTKTILPMGTGTRHRSAVSITERADAIALVASEERGEVSVAYKGTLIRAQTERDFLELVQRAYQGKSIERES